MADNVIISSGTGTTVKTDQVGTAHVQFVKLMDGSADNSDVIQSSGNALLVSHQGTADVTVVNTIAVSGSVTALSLATGTVDVVAIPVITVGTVSDVLSLATGTVNVVNTIAVSGSVTALSLATGTVDVVAIPVITVGTVSDVLSLATGTVNVVNTIAVSGSVTALSLATGTVDVVDIPVLTVGTVSDVLTLSTGTVDIAAMPVVTVGTVSDVLSVATGTVDVVAMPVVTVGSVSNVLSVDTGTVDALLIAGTATVGGIRVVAHDSLWQAYAVCTTSAATGTIIKTSGAHTLYVTDVLVSVDGPMGVKLCSETTAFSEVYLATKGGFAMNMINPLVCTSNQSLRFICASSGSGAVTAVGYTVT